MTNKEYGIIMGYFDKKHVNREELEKSCDFDNLTMTKDVATDISKLLSDEGYKKSESQKAISQFVRFVKSRSGTGEITWDVLIKDLKNLDLEYSEFGIRAQNFGKAYWEVFFDHFNIENCESGNVKLTFDHEYYYETENERAWEVLDKYGIDGDVPTEKALSIISEKWTSLSDGEKDELISAFAVPTTTHYVDKSRMMILKEDVEKIHRTNADLVPQMGLRNYTITFTNGENVYLRF